MSVEIHIHEDSAEKVRQAMIGLLGNGMHEVLAQEAPALEKTGKRKAAPTEPTKSEPGHAEPTKSEPGKADAKTAYKPVGELILKTVAAKGRDAVVALLKKYSAAMGSQLKPEQYPAFTAECRALLDGN